MTPTIAFDGDDTLWHNETVFSLTQERFAALMARYTGGGDIMERLLDTEARNLSAFGYGIKGFTLSMIETAIDLTDGRIAADELRALLDLGKAMLRHPVELIDGARETLASLKGRYRLLLITKGDLFDQESKIARSGLDTCFDAIEIVSEKDEHTYSRILERHAIARDRFVMVGNSIRSDILPVLAVGARAIHIPYAITWAHERAPHPTDGGDRLLSLASIAELPDRIGTWF